MQQGHQQHWNTLLRTYVTFIAAICVCLAIISASCPLTIMTRLRSALYFDFTDRQLRQR